MTRAVWVVVALIFVARAIAAFRLPLTGDEAYYWEWSRRLAVGYVDHPPMVAWTIRLFTQFGAVAGLVRLGFVLCGVIATLALAACTSLVAGDRRAGAVAALLLSLAPLSSVSFAAATPDGPFLMFWCLALWFAARAFTSERLSDSVLLGIALGAALLSRFFAFALLCGIAACALYASRRTLRHKALFLSFTVAFIVFLPFLVWNVLHGWVSFAFALVHRHEESRSGFSLLRLAMLEAGAAIAYSPGIWAVAIICALRPANAMLGWTAVPLFAFLTAFAVWHDVEVYWFLGAFASLCALAGIAYVRAPQPSRLAWSWIAVVPATVLVMIMFTAALVPGSAYRFLQRATGITLRNTGPFEIFTFAPLARDAARLARARDAVVMTDGYGLSSVLDFDASVYPVVIGYDWQGRESHAWYPSAMRPKRALFVDKEPLSTRPDFQRRLARACTRVVDGGAHAYRYGSAPPRKYYFTWCDDLKANGLAILRWQTP